MVTMSDWTRAVLELSGGSRNIGQFLPALGRLLSQNGQRVTRLFTSIQSLHPEFRARSYVWYAGWEVAEVKSWPHGLANRPGYFESPDYHVHLSKKPFRIRLADLIPATECDFYGSLKAEGFSDYLMVPLRFSNGTVNTLSFATRDPTGFRSELLDALQELSLPITVLFERFVAEETAASTLSAYLGFSAARHVLGGVVRVGQGRRIEAVVLFGDLHGYTRLSASLSPAETVVLLNDYFDCVVGAIEDRGGHVLKFIGDAFLAVFLIENKSRPICAAATIGAVQEIRRRLARLNKRREEQALPALSHSVAVHFGPVVYGNVGSTTRLDFTVIGQEVNVAARIQEAAKSLNLDYVFTDQYVAAFGDAGLVRHGPYKLNELGREVDLYTLCEEAPLDSVLRYGPYISAV